MAASFEELHPRGRGGKFTDKTTGRDSVPTTTHVPVTPDAPGVEETPALASAVAALRTRVTLDQVQWAGPEEVVLPAGTYWVGDPCYAITDEPDSTEDAWLTWLRDARAIESDDDPGVYVAAVADGNVVVAFGTAYGDGMYRWEGTRPEFESVDSPVDAGLLGIVPDAYLAGRRPPGMRRVTFTAPVACRVEQENGHIVCFGDVRIVTDEPDGVCEDCGNPCPPGDEVCDTCLYDREAEDEEAGEDCCRTCGERVGPGGSDVCSGCDPDGQSDADW